MFKYELNKEYTSRDGSQKSRIVVKENFYKGQSAFVVEVALAYRSKKKQGQFQPFKNDCAFLDELGAHEFMSTFEI